MFGKMYSKLGAVLLIGLIGGATIGFLVSPLIISSDKINNQLTILEFDLLAYQFGWDPNYIEVNQGDHVILNINSTADIEPGLIHSIIIQGYGISENLPLGETTIVEFDATIAGEFRIECGIFCGQGHTNMVMFLIVHGEVEEETLNPVTNLYNTTKWNNNELMLVIEREGRSVVFIDGSTNELVGRISEIGHQPHTAVFSSDAKYAFIIGRGGWLIKVNLNNLEVEKFIRVGVSSRGTGITSDDKYIVIGNYAPFSFVIINASTLNIIKEYQIPFLYNQSSGDPFPSRVAAIIDTVNSNGDNLMILALKDLGEVWVLNMSDAPHFPIVKIFLDVGDFLHDAFLTADGRYYMLASQASNWIWVMDTETLTEVAKIPTGIRPHPGPGAVWNDLAFSPSIGEGLLMVYNTSDWTQVTNISIGGAGLFVRAYSKNMGGYPFIWWDTVISNETALNRQIYVLNATQIVNGEPINVTTLEPGARSLHPEFSYNGNYVYVSCWDDSKVVIYDAWNFNIITEITYLTTPTGIFNVGLRIEEPGV